MIRFYLCVWLLKKRHSCGQWRIDHAKSLFIFLSYFIYIFIHQSFLQIGYERHWLHFLKEFIVPVNARLYPGYNSEVRLNPTLRP